MLGGTSDKKTVQRLNMTFLYEKTKSKSLLTVEQKTYKRVWRCSARHGTVYSLEGAGFKVFSSEAAMGLDIFNKASAECSVLRYMWTVSSRLQPGLSKRISCLGH